MNQDEEFKVVLTRYSEGTATAEEIAYLESRYIQWNEAKTRSRSEEEFKAVDQLMWENISSRTNIQRTQPVQPVKLWRRIAAAVAVITVISGAGLFYFFNHTNKDVQTTYYKNDIAPGKTGATLTLANGKTISLADAVNGEIAKQTGVSVRKTADGQLVYEIKEGVGKTDEINTLSTASGQTYMLTLPDQSKVWMNAASSLTYSAALMDHGIRKVKLVGEAYFEIAKDKVHPFVVESRGQAVQVLGTHFNINSYQDEPATKTTLLEGSVQVSTLHPSPLRGEVAKPVRGEEIILKPGQQSILSGTTIHVENVDLQDAVSWKNGLFRFQDASIEEIMRQLSRWYNIEVVYAGTPTKEGLTGKIFRNTNISEVLLMLEQTKSVHFKIEGRRVTVMK